LLGQAIGALEETLGRRSDGQFAMPYDVRRQNALLKAIDGHTKVQIELSYGQGRQVVDTVRNIVLNWALELEKKGILGEGLSFSRDEKVVAQPVSQQIVAQNIGFIGSAHSGASVNATQSVNYASKQNQVLTFIKEAQAAVSLLPQDTQARVQRELQALEAESTAEPQDGSKIDDILSSIRATCEGAAGSVVAQGIISLIDKLL
jgi:AbiTii